MRLQDFGVVSRIDELPGCSQIAVFNGVFAPQESRAKGNGKLAHSRRLWRAKNLGFDVALCTVVVGNHAQEHILQEQGWVPLQKFKSSKTENEVCLWWKKL